MTNLTPHFTLEELTASSTAKARGIDNTPTEVHKKTLKHTCEYLLEPLRKLLNEHYGEPIIMVVTSGYRSPALNKAVGGSETSEHSLGQAVDFNAFKLRGNVKVKIPTKEVYELIKQWNKAGKLSVNQCIFEVTKTMWVHVSMSSAGATKNKNQFLKFIGGRYIND